MLGQVTRHACRMGADGSRNNTSCMVHHTLSGSIMQQPVVASMHQRTLHHHHHHRRTLHHVARWTNCCWNINEADPESTVPSQKARICICRVLRLHVCCRVCVAASMLVCTAAWCEEPLHSTLGSHTAAARTEKTSAGPAATTQGCLRVQCCCLQQLLLLLLVLFSCLTQPQQRCQGQLRQQHSWP